MKPGQIRQHAKLLKTRYLGQNSRDAEAATVQAVLMEAQAELAEAQADIPSPAPEENCEIKSRYPVIGEVITRGGKIENIQYPWKQNHADLLHTQDVDMAFEWCHDPRAGLGQGKLIRIYIGTQQEGPRIMWHDGIWSTHKSRGNYRKNWAYGGNWSTIDNKKSKNLNIIAPDLAQKIKEVKMDIEKVKKAEAKIEAAKKRILACSQRDMAAASMRQAAHPAYPGQDVICAGKAASAEAFAARSDAEADLIEAKAGL